MMKLPVNYLAHIGGLLSGALIGLAFKLRPDSINTDYLDAPEQAARYDEKMRQVAAFMNELEFGRAKPLLKTLRRTHPQDRRVLVLYQLYQVCRQEPAGEDYHQVCLEILSLTERDPATERLIADVAEEYVQRARPKPRLTPAQIEPLAVRLLASGSLKPAEYLVRAMLNHPTHFTSLPVLLARLASAYRTHQPDKARIYQELLRTRFPDSVRAGQSVNKNP